MWRGVRTGLGVMLGFLTARLGLMLAQEWYIGRLTRKWVKEGILKHL